MKSQPNNLYSNKRAKIYSSDEEKAQPTLVFKKYLHLAAFVNNRNVLHLKF